MEADYFRMLYDYGYWARDRLLAAADGLPDAEFVRPNGFTYGSIRGVMSHALIAETVFGARFRGEPPASPPKPEDITSVALLRKLWEADGEKMRGFLETLRDDSMHHMVQTRRGDLPLWQLLAHVANHGTQHRSEAAEMLTQIGRSPGDLDLMQYLLAKHDHLTDGAA